MNIFKSITLAAALFAFPAISFANPDTPPNYGEYGFTFEPCYDCNLEKADGNYRKFLDYKFNTRLSHLVGLITAFDMWSLGPGKCLNGTDRSKGLAEKYREVESWGDVIWNPGEPHEMGVAARDLLTDYIRNSAANPKLMWPRAWDYWHKLHMFEVDSDGMSVARMFGAGGDYFMDDVLVRFGQSMTQLVGYKNGELTCENSNLWASEIEASLEKWARTGDMKAIVDNSMAWNVNTAAIHVYPKPMCDMAAADGSCDALIKPYFSFDPSLRPTNPFTNKVISAAMEEEEAEFGDLEEGGYAWEKANVDKYLRDQKAGDAQIAKTIEGFLKNLPVESCNMSSENCEEELAEFAEKNRPAPVRSTRAGSKDKSFTIPQEVTELRTKAEFWGLSKTTQMYQRKADRQCYELILKEDEADMMIQLGGSKMYGWAFRMLLDQMKANPDMAKADWSCLFDWYEARKITPTSMKEDLNNVR